MKINSVIAEKCKSAFEYIKVFCGWFIVSVIVGVLGGITGSLFHMGIDYATQMRNDFPYIIFAMPAVGILIVFLYRFFKLSQEGDTNKILKSIRNNESVPLVLAPLIFLGTVLTHLVGGSAGREGAALQLGGTIGNRVGKLFKLSEKDNPIVVMCGMASVFSALFGTPLTAMVFSVEVVSVGLFYYSAFVPCLISGLSAYGVALIMGVKPIKFFPKGVETTDLNLVWRAAVIGLTCAIVSILFCVILKLAKKYLEKLLKNDYLRVVAGSLVLIGLTIIVGSQRYNGTGMQIITNAINNGQAYYYDFAVKIIFTAITIAVGFKGGEMIPSFFIGATLGCVVGGLIGLDCGLAAALGLIGIFCGAFNCPLAALVLSVEFFGSQNIIAFGIVICISYMFSGYYSVYSSQKIMYSKLHAQFINKDAD